MSSSACCSTGQLPAGPTRAVGEAERLLGAVHVQLAPEGLFAVGVVLGGRQPVHVPGPGDVQGRDQGGAGPGGGGGEERQPDLLVAAHGLPGVRADVEAGCGGGGGGSWGGLDGPVEHGLRHPSADAAFGPSEHAPCGKVSAAHRSARCLPLALMTSTDSGSWAGRPASIAAGCIIAAAPNFPRTSGRSRGAGEPAIAARQGCCCSVVTSCCEHIFTGRGPLGRRVRNSIVLCNAAAMRRCEDCRFYGNICEIIVPLGFRKEVSPFRLCPAALPPQISRQPIICPTTNTSTLPGRASPAELPPPPHSACLLRRRRIGSTRTRTGGAPARLRAGAFPGNGMPG
jgi:hypothetical protein